MNDNPRTYHRHFRLMDSPSNLNSRIYTYTDFMPFPSPSSLKTSFCCFYLRYFISHFASTLAFISDIYIEWGGKSLPCSKHPHWLKIFYFKCLLHCDGMKSRSLYGSQKYHLHSIIKRLDRQQPTHCSLPNKNDKHISHHHSQGYYYYCY